MNDAEPEPTGPPAPPPFPIGDTRSEPARRSWLSSEPVLFAIAAALVLLTGVVAFVDSAREGGDTEANTTAAVTVIGLLSVIYGITYVRGARIGASRLTIILAVGLSLRLVFSGPGSDAETGPPSDDVEEGFESLREAGAFGSERYSERERLEMLVDACDERFVAFPGRCVASYGFTAES